MKMNRVTNDCTMRRLVYVILLLIQINLAKADIPNCAYEDTVDLTDSKALSNGSYNYEGVLIPYNLVGTYDYEILFGGISKTVPEHKRGCVCQIKQCVKYCCPRNELKVEDKRQCSSNEKMYFNPNITINKENVNVLDKFVFQQNLPCNLVYPLETEYELENNTLYFDSCDDNDNCITVNLSSSDYCMTQDIINGEYVLTPLLCHELTSFEINEWITQIAMLISVPFFIATIFVYLLIPKLRNLHGMCLSSYLLAVAIGYTLLVMNNIGIEYMEFTKKTCFAFGFAAYYFVMAAFFWLNVISFDLWRNLHGAFGRYERHQSKNKRFSFYSLYAWGCPVLLTIIAKIVQDLDIEEHLKPGIGSDSENAFSCWLKSKDWSAMIYMCGISTIIISTNIILFIASFLKIYTVKKESKKMMSNDGNYRHVGKQWDNFLLYLRLFIVMGVSWMFEVIAYLAGTNDSTWFFITDGCNALQGSIIFALFVIKPKVLLLIKERIRSRDSKLSPKSIKLSSKSTHTSI